jgi:hypothetical protein
MALSCTVMHFVNSVQEQSVHASTAIIVAYLCCSGYKFAATLLTLFTVLCIRGYGAVLGLCPWSILRQGVQCVEQVTGMYTQYSSHSVTTSMLCS